MRLLGVQLGVQLVCTPQERTSCDVVHTGPVPKSTGPAVGHGLYGFESKWSSGPLFL